MTNEATPREVGLSDQLGACQPIETAPRDGSVILGFYYERWYPIAWNDKWQLEGCCFADESIDCEPTHWMPMPAPPVSA